MKWTLSSGARQSNAAFALEKRNLKKENTEGNEALSCFLSGGFEDGALSPPLNLFENRIK